MVKYVKASVGRSYSLVNNSHKEWADLGLGRIMPNKYCINEDNKDEILEELGKRYKIGQYNYGDVSTCDLWYWHNVSQPESKYFTLTFNKNLPDGEIDEIIRFVDNLIDSPKSSETYLDYAFVRNDDVCNDIAAKFIESSDGKVIKYRGQNATISEHHRYNGNNISSFVMPLRNKRNGYVLDNLQTAVLAIDNGAVDYLKSSKSISRKGSKYVRASSNNNDEYSNIKIDVYDIAKFVENDTDGKYALFNYDDGAAILFKPDGSGCIVDYEAIGESFDSMSDTVILELTDVPEKGKMFIAPQYQANVSIREIIDKSPHKTMTVDEFFTKRNYNSRCINNFNGIKEYLK